MADFLSTYKDLENTLKTVNGMVSVKDYEDLLGDNDESDRLRLARNIRNYYSHHSDGEALIKVNKDMITFLEGEINKVNNSRLLVKDKYKTISKSKYIFRQDNLYNIMNYMYNQKISVCYIINDDNILLGEVLFIDIIGEQLKGTAPTKLKKIDIAPFIKKSNVAMTTKTTPLENLNNGYYLVLDDSTKYKKVLGELSIK